MSDTSDVDSLPLAHRRRQAGSMGLNWGKYGERESSGRLFIDFLSLAGIAMPYTFGFACARAM